MNVPFDEYWQEARKVARAQGIVSAFRILSDIDRRFGKDTAEVDRLLDMLDVALEEDG